MLRDVFKSYCIVKYYSSKNKGIDIPLIRSVNGGFGAIFPRHTAALKESYMTVQ